MQHNQDKTSICIIITGDAYGSFLQNEMPYILRKFNDVVVFAYSKPDVIRNNYSHKVRVLPLNITQGRWRVIKYGLMGLFVLNPKLRLKFGVLKSFRQIIASLYARGRANYVYRKILRNLKEHDIKTGSGVVYSYWFTDHAIVAWQLAVKLNRYGGHFKSVSRAHGYDLYWERNAAKYLPFQDVSLEHLDGVYPCSDNGARYLMAKWPMFAEKIHIARLGTKDYGMAPIPRNQMSFVTCCLFDPVKRMDLFAEAFCKIWKENHECHWYCIGDGTELKKVIAVVEKHEAGPGVSFMGMMSNEAIMNFYSDMPISWFVNVSSSEGVPVTIMEALSFGIPVIATNVGGSGEMINESCGYLVNSQQTVDSLSSILRKAINCDAEEYVRKRTSARQVWEQKASADKNYEAWVEALFQNIR